MKRSSDESTKAISQRLEVPSDSPSPKFVETISNPAPPLPLDKKKLIIDCHNKETLEKTIANENLFNSLSDEDLCQIAAFSPSKNIEYLMNTRRVQNNPSLCDTLFNFRRISFQAEIETCDRQRRLK